MGKGRPAKNEIEKKVVEPVVENKVVPTAEKKNDDKKKKKSKSRASFKIYLFKTLKQCHPHIGISGKAMNIMNEFVHDLFERLVHEAVQLTKFGQKPTMTSREIQTSVRLVLPGELSNHAVMEGSKAVAKYVHYKEN